ncbi:hypothetical protein NXS19_003099 [Fusarium pseudograminearum]|nr:hypothetical protein NXS19_003099 [Fusarium pseudograminearum]
MDARACSKTTIPDGYLRLGKILRLQKKYKLAWPCSSLTLFCTLTLYASILILGVVTQKRNLQGSFVHSWIWYPLFWQQRQAFFHNIHLDKTGSQDANGWDGSDDDDRDVRASRI